MRVTRIIAPLVLILFVTTIALGKVRVDYDHSVNFSKFKTFMWLETPRTQDPFMANRIVEAVNAQLTARGLRQVKSNADLGVTASSLTREVPALNTYYGGYSSWGWGGPGWAWGWGPGWGWGGPMWSATAVDTFLENTTTVNLIDNDTEKPVWQGVRQGSVSDKADKASRKTTKGIGEMFEKYPFGYEN